MNSRLLTYAGVLAGATVVSAAGVLVGPALTAVPGGLLLGFALPGLALTGLLFRQRALSTVERMVLAAGLSLATLIVSGLLLYVAGVYLDRTSWTLAAAGVTLVALVLTVATSRPSLASAETELIPVYRDGATLTKALPGPFAPWSAEHKVEVRQLMRQLLPMILVLAVLAGAGYLSFASSRAGYDVTVTTLSAAPPGPVNTAGDRVVRVTASGLVSANGPYQLRVTEPDGTQVVARDIPVDGAGSWSAALTLPSEDRLTVGLFRAGDTTAYRTLLIAAAS